MGLETGWNCHISLLEDSAEKSTEVCLRSSKLVQNTGELNSSNCEPQGQSQLPRGIKNIRPHLDNVDDVPLLVPLFTGMCFAVFVISRRRAHPVFGRLFRH